MKRIPVFPAACLILLFSCTQQSNISPKPFTAGMLAKQEFTVDPSRDTTLHTLHGAVISIKAGSFTARSPIDIEIREAFTPSEILAAGLTTTSNGRPLRSAGMIYINATADDNNIALQKPINISIPNNYYEEQMQVFKGVETDSGMNWIEPEPVDTTPQSENWKAGKQLFNTGCASCHKIGQDMTGPDLRGVERRWKNHMHLKMWIRNWETAVYYGIPRAIEAQNLKPTAMNKWEFLSDKQLDQIIAYITNESLKRVPVPESPCADTLYISTPKQNQSFLNTELTPAATIPADTGSINETIDNPAEKLPGTRQLADTSLRGIDKREQQIYTGGAYDFEITTNGWYNIDALIDVEGTTHVKLKATVEGNNSYDMTVYLFCPDKKIMVNSTDFDGKNYLFNKFGEDGIPLFLNDRAVLIAFGGKGEKMYLGATEFYLKEEQTISIKIEATTPGKVKTIFRDKKIGSIDIGIDKKQMMIHEIPCDLKYKADSARKAL